MVLTGEGGDELFAGYARYAGERLAPLFGRLPRSAAPARRDVGAAARRPLAAPHRALRALPAGRAAAARDLVPAHAAGGAGGAGRRRARRAVARAAPERCSPTPGRSRRAGSISRMLYVDTKLWLPDDLLARGDKMSMAASLEARVPLLDHRLVEFAAALPPDLKVRGFTRKYLLRKVAGDLLPEPILAARRGLPRADGAWLRGEAREFCRDLLSPDTVRRRGLFAPGASPGCSPSTRPARRTRPVLWALLSVELWHRAFVDRERRAMAAPARSGPWLERCRQAPVPRAGAGDRVADGRPRDARAPRAHRDVRGQPDRLAAAPPRRSWSRISAARTPTPRCGRASSRASASRPRSRRPRALRTEPPSWLSRRGSAALAAYVRAQDARLLHFHYLTDARFLLGLQRRTGLPAIVSGYGYDVSSFPGQWHGLGRRYLRPIFARLDLVLAMSEDMRRDVLGLGCPEAKVAVHYYGSDTTRFRGFPEREPTTRARNRRSSPMGRLHAQKGQDLLLRALRRLDGRGRRFRIVFVGDGPLRPGARAPGRGLRLGGQGDVHRPRALRQRNARRAPALRRPLRASQRDRRRAEGGHSRNDRGGDGGRPARRGRLPGARGYRPCWRTGATASSCPSTTSTPSRMRSTRCSPIRRCARGSDVRPPTVRTTSSTSTRAPPSSSGSTTASPARPMLRRDPREGTRHLDRLGDVVLNPMES